MKILLDENLPVKLISHFDNRHEVFTTYEMNWNGKLNGELLSLLNENMFDVFITADKNLRYQQHHHKYQFSVIVSDAPNTRITTLIPYIIKVNKLLNVGLKEGINEIVILIVPASNMRVETIPFFYCSLKRHFYLLTF